MSLPENNNIIGPYLQKSDPFVSILAKSTKTSPELELGLKLEALLEENIKSRQVSPKILRKIVKTKNIKNETVHKFNTQKIDKSEQIFTREEKNNPKCTIVVKKMGKFLVTPFSDSHCPRSNNSAKRFAVFHKDIIPDKENGKVIKENFEGNNRNISHCVGADRLRGQLLNSKGRVIKNNVKSLDTSSKGEGVSPQLKITVRNNLPTVDVNLTRKKNKEKRNNNVSKSKNSGEEPSVRQSEEIKGKQIIGNLCVGTPNKTIFLNEEKVLAAVKAMMKLFTSKSASIPDNNLFSDSPKEIKIQINTVKNLETPQNFIRIELKHRLISKEGEICLFVSNIKGKRRAPETAIEHYTQVLKSSNVQFIKEIVPLRKLETDYNQFEQKRKLSCQFDFFLVEAPVCHRIIRLLGKHFYANHRIPVPVVLKEEGDIKKNIERGLRRCTITVSGQSRNSFTAQVGHTQLTEEEITENLMALAVGLQTKFPGGWKNIRSLHIWIPESDIVPIYYSVLSPNDIERPFVENKIKLSVPAIGELSTIPGATVVVYPSGDVTLTKRKMKGDNDENVQKIKRKKGESGVKDD